MKAKPTKPDPNESKLQVETLSVETLIPYARNSRTHSEEQVAQIAGSIREFGFTNPVLIDADNGIIAGHGRVLAARKLGLAEVPCIRLAHLTEAQLRAYVIADNKLALNAGWDEELLKVELQGLQEEGFDLELTGFSDEELSALLDSGEPGQSSSTSEGGRETLAERFGVPPFSVLNAREGEWQKRKQEWIAVGIKSELGRGENSKNSASGPGGLMGYSWTASDPTFYAQKKSKELELGRDIETKEFIENFYTAPAQEGFASGTSIFDPTLTELLVCWFSPKNGIILDPFAGGSVRGIVSAKLGRQYIGVELRKEQVQANREQADAIFADPKDISPVWHCGDSATIDAICHDVKADMVLGCPPYADLEVYSEDPRDISNKDYPEFLRLYREIIKKTCSLLNPDSFVAWVIGEIRDKHGNYHNFVGDTVQAFKDAGLSFYNEAILVTAVGSLPIRVGRQFSASRKLGKTHQNVLVFVKGDEKKAAQRCGDCGDAVDLSVADTGEEEQTAPLQ